MGSEQSILYEREFVNLVEPVTNIGKHASDLLLLNIFLRHYNADKKRVFFISSDGLFAALVDADSVQILFADKRLKQALGEFYYCMNQKTNPSSCNTNNNSNNKRLALPTTVAGFLKQRPFPLVHVPYVKDVRFLVARPASTVALCILFPLPPTFETETENSPSFYAWHPERQLLHKVDLQDGISCASESTTLPGLALLTLAGECCFYDCSGMYDSATFSPPELLWKLNVSSTMSIPLCIQCSDTTPTTICFCVCNKEDYHPEKRLAKKVEFVLVDENGKHMGSTKPFVDKMRVMTLKTRNVSIGVYQGRFFCMQLAPDEQGHEKNMLETFCFLDFFQEDEDIPTNPSLPTSPFLHAQGTENRGDDDVLGLVFSAPSSSSVLYPIHKQNKKQQQEQKQPILWALGFVSRYLLAVELQTSDMQQMALTQNNNIISPSLLFKRKMFVWDFATTRWLPCPASMPALFLAGIVPNPRNYRTDDCLVYSYGLHNKAGVMCLESCMHHKTPRPIQIPILCFEDLVKETHMENALTGNNTAISQTLISLFQFQQDAILCLPWHLFKNVVYYIDQSTEENTNIIFAPFVAIRHFDTTGVALAILPASMYEDILALYARSNTEVGISLRNPVPLSDIVTQVRETHYNSERSSHSYDTTSILITLLFQFKKLQTVQCVVSWAGHGTSKTLSSPWDSVRKNILIGGLDLQRFQNMLLKIHEFGNVSLFVLISCFSGGFSASKLLPSTSLNFPLIQNSISDTLVSVNSFMYNARYIHALKTHDLAGLTDLLLSSNSIAFLKMRLQIRPANSLITHVYRPNWLALPDKTHYLTEEDVDNMIRNEIGSYTLHHREDLFLSATFYPLELFIFLPSPPSKPTQIDSLAKTATIVSSFPGEAWHSIDCIHLEHKHDDRQGQDYKFEPSVILDALVKIFYHRYSFSKTFLIKTLKYSIPASTLLFVCTNILLAATFEEDGHDKEEAVLHFRCNDYSVFDTKTQKMLSHEEQTLEFHDDWFVDACLYAFYNTSKKLVIKQYEENREWTSESVEWTIEDFNELTNTAFSAAHVQIEAVKQKTLWILQHCRQSLWKYFIETIDETISETDKTREKKYIMNVLQDADLWQALSTLVLRNIGNEIAQPSPSRPLKFLVLQQQQQSKSEGEAQKSLFAAIRSHYPIVADILESLFFFKTRPQSLETIHL